jgi:putative lipoic acid-binding regulatory protein
MVEPCGPLRFPTDYTLKVVGRPGEEFRAHVHTIVLRHAPALPAGRVSERLSANGDFLSISYLLPAKSRTQVEGLVADLGSCDGVLRLL